MISRKFLLASIAIVATCALSGAATEAKPTVSAITDQSEAPLNGKAANQRVSDLLTGKRFGSAMISNLPSPAKYAMMAKLAPIIDDNLIHSPERAGRILNGHRAASLTQAPWQAGLLLAAYNDNNRMIYCGGALIDSTHVLTAAHCVKNELGTFGATDVDVLVGTIDFTDTAQGQRIHAKHIYVHPNYDPKTYDHDLAVIVLEQPGSTGQAVALPPAVPYPIPAGTMLTISGWGYTTNNGDLTSALQIATVPTANIASCNAATAYNGAVKPDMICAGGSGIDACEGDSGGPAVFEGTPVAHVTPVLDGIVSWGAKDDCGNSNKLGVYTAVSPHLDWIKQQMTL